MIPIPYFFHLGSDGFFFLVQFCYVYSTYIHDLCNVNFQQLTCQQIEKEPLGKNFQQLTCEQIEKEP